MTVISTGLQPVLTWDAPAGASKDELSQKGTGGEFKIEHNLFNTIRILSSTEYMR